MQKYGIWVCTGKQLTNLTLNAYWPASSTLIGANRPGTVPDLEPLSRVPPGNENLPGLSWNSKDP